jgi:hypothetical protein
LDFGYRHLIHYPKILNLLDKWVLLLKPTSESLTEGYKMIKSGLTMNPHLECFVLLQTKVNPMLDSTIFERFAGVVSKHLKAHLGWLGWLDLSDRDRFFDAKLNVEQLESQFSPIQTSPERLAIAQWVDRIERIPVEVELPEGGKE